MTENLMTPFQMATRRRNANICKVFKKLKKENKLATSWRICQYIAKDLTISPAQVANIIRANELYETGKHE